MKFSKYHGCGNDFVIVENQINDLSKLAKDICERNTGVGADGLINVDTTSITMDFYNQDGSTGTMCGNGLRSLSAYLLDKQIVKENHFTVFTKAGEMQVEVLDMMQSLFKINLGLPSFDCTKLQIKVAKPTFIEQRIDYQNQPYICYAVMIGVKHLVIYVDDLEKITNDIGEYFSHYPLFEDSINVDFVKIKNENEIYLKTYERGVGFTKACGTGAAASFIITNKYKHSSGYMRVTMDIDSLDLTMNDKKEIIMIGSAAKICDGTYIWRNK